MRKQEIIRCKKGEKSVNCGGQCLNLNVHLALYLTLILEINSFVIHLTPDDHFSGRTAPLTSRCCIFLINSTNIRTEYFKHAVYSVFSSSKCRLFHNATFFGPCIIHILYTRCAQI